MAESANIPRTPANWSMGSLGRANAMVYRVNILTILRFEIQFTSRVHASQSDDGTTAGPIDRPSTMFVNSFRFEIIDFAPNR